MTELERQLTVPQGSFVLERYPIQAKQALRAWDAADEYLLTHLAAVGAAASRVLVVNDVFGALTTALAGGGHSVQMQSDSWLAHSGTKANLEANALSPVQVTLLDSLTSPSQPFDVLLFKVPKSLALLEDQLIRLRPLLTQETLIIGAGMVKQIHTSTLNLCQRILGPTTTSLASRKARLIHCTLAEDTEISASPYPTSYEVDGTGLSLSNHAALFSRDQLDGGTRFLLEHLPRSPAARCIIDLGCGNGVLGISAARHHKQASVIFTDESAMAIASARENATAILGDQRDMTFHWTDGLKGIAPHSADLILCNPPFHQQQTVGDAVSWRMFQQARKVLEPGGSIYVVGNRHLGYHTKLRRLFGNGDVIASNPKFVVLHATTAE